MHTGVLSWDQWSKNTLQQLGGLADFDRLLRAIILLNLVDAVCTLYWITTGAATEANPMMAPLLEMSPLVFVAAKFALVTLGIALLARHPQQAVARSGVKMILLVYLAIVVGHLHHGALTALSNLDLAVVFR